MDELYIILTDITIELSEEPGEEDFSKNLEELWVYGLPDSEGGTRFQLCKAEHDKKKWRMRGFVELPPAADKIKLVVRSDDDEDAYQTTVDYAPVRTGELEVDFKAARSVFREMEPSPGRRMEVRMRQTFAKYERLSRAIGKLGHKANARYHRTWDVSNIQDAISLERRALDLTPDGHPDLALRLGNLGSSLWSRFERSGEDSDLAEAISFERRALELTPDGHPDLSLRLANLGSSLWSRFRGTGEDSDLAEAISFERRALKLTPDGHPDLAQRFSNLGLSLLSRFMRTGEDSDIAEAISFKRRALELTPDGHPDLALRLSNLGSSLLSRFRRTGEDSDLAEAISFERRALELTPDGHPDLSLRLANLGSSLWSRFRGTGEDSDLAEAISFERRALKLTPDGHPDLAQRFSNLGLSLLSRFMRTGEDSDIAEAISFKRRALELTPDGHPDLALRLSNLGSSLLSRFERTGEDSDLEEAILRYRRALELTPEGHPNICVRLVNLADILSRSDLPPIQEATPDPISAAILYCKRASSLTTASTIDRLKAANKWISLLKQHDPTSADFIPAFDCVLSVSALRTGLGETIQGRYSQLQNDSLNQTLNASATAFAMGHPDKALEWLEQGRCLVWGQLNNLRSPLDELRAHDGELADSIATISRQLDALALSRAHSHQSRVFEGKMWLEDEVGRHQKLARQWEDLVTQARGIHGFDRFLLPPLPQDLLRHLPPSGYVVIINVHADRCDALALSSSMLEARHIPLPAFSLKKAEMWRGELKASVTGRFCMRQCAIEGDSDGARGARLRRGSTLGPLATILRGLWLDLVKPIFDALGLEHISAMSAEAPPRVWWCPTGILSFLPLHAAGIYEEGKKFVSALDYAIPSYTPTITSLIARVKNSRRISKEVSGLLMTSQPCPKYARAFPIPGTTEEVQSLFSRAGESGTRALKLEGDEVTVEGYLGQLERFSSVHLACHGSQDAADPLASRFLFHDGPLELREIIKQNLHNADLAFLSACQTSAGAEKLANEAVHLAAGMLAAGYRRVVATMWAINDKEATRVARDFYDYILDVQEEGDMGGFDGSRSAEALHYAIQRLRSRRDVSESSLFAWVPYVHWGY